jgi:hypothetical protein
MRILQLIQHTNILQLDIQELIHALERTPDRDVILEFDRHFVVNERFEETICAICISDYSRVCGVCDGSVEVVPEEEHFGGPVRGVGEGSGGFGCELVAALVVGGIGARGFIEFVMKVRP